MTYLLYGFWLLSMVLAVGELDNLVSRRILQRLKLAFPETHWLTSSFLSIMLPGLGQFLNAQPLKALMLFAWPFLTLWGYPVPRPWALWGLKSGWMLLPWWLIAIGDALVVGWLRQRQQRLEPAQRSDLPSNTIDYDTFLEKRQKRQNSGT